MKQSQEWLSADEGPPFTLINPHGASSAVLLCDHASHKIPRSLGTLGLSEADRIDHIAWDPGAFLLAQRLSHLLDAPLIASGWSRLVIDCNRPPGVSSSIPSLTGGVSVPGNMELSPEERTQREEQCFWPYHHAIEKLLDERKKTGKKTAILSMHSFTPVLQGSVRPWQIAMLYGRDRTLAGHFIDHLRKDPSLTVGDNEPYRVTDQGDYSIPVYAERRGFPGVLIEVRNDQLREESSIERYAQMLASIYQTFSQHGDEMESAHASAK